MVPYFILLLAHALDKLGDRDAALERLTEALHIVEGTGEDWCKSELHRFSGEVMRAKGRDDLAETYYYQALTTAQYQSAKTWELSAALSLSRLWRDQGKRAKARDLLAPIYDWFTEGFSTPVLQDSKSLLGSLE